MAPNGPPPAPPAYRPYTKKGLPRKRPGPAPKPKFELARWKNKKPVSRVERSYTRERKIEVLMFLLNHRIAETKPQRVPRRRLGQPAAEEPQDTGTTNENGEVIWHRAPTYAEAAVWFKIPMPTIHGWWDNRAKILDGTGIDLPKMPKTLPVPEWLNKPLEKDGPQYQQTSPECTPGPRPPQSPKPQITVSASPLPPKPPNPPITISASPLPGVPNQLISPSPYRNPDPVTGARPTPPHLRVQPPPPYVQLHPSHHVQGQPPPHAQAPPPPHVQAQPPRHVRVQPPPPPPPPPHIDQGPMPRQPPPLAGTIPPPDLPMIPWSVYPPEPGAPPPAPVNGQIILAGSMAQIRSSAEAQRTVFINSGPPAHPIPVQRPRQQPHQGALTRNQAPMPLAPPPQQVVKPVAPPPAPVAATPRETQPAETAVETPVDTNQTLPTPGSDGREEEDGTPGVDEEENREEADGHGSRAESSGSGSPGQEDEDTAMEDAEAAVARLQGA